jgi:hypothetical protein
MRKLSFLALTLAVMSGPALAGDAAKEISTAATHAEMAGAAGDAHMVQMHLHHVLNCINGPGGMDFDAAAGNPCKDAGDGALKDAPDKAMALNAAAAKAKEGLAATDITVAKADAMEAANILNKAK